MPIRYCLPVIQPNQQAVLDALYAHLRDYDYIEIWLDYIEDLDDAFIETLQQRLGKKLILLFRRQNLETIHLSPERRQQIMTLLDGSQTLLDLDISQKDDLAYLRAQSLRIPIIVSYHNYKQTPSDGELNGLVAAMKAYNPAILKLATQCRQEADALRLLRLLLSMREQKQKCLVLGMGPSGLATRILGPLWGNAMSFAPESSDEQSAPGQLTRRQLETIFNTIGAS